MTAPTTLPLADQLRLLELIGKYGQARASITRAIYKGKPYDQPEADATRLIREIGAMIRGEKAEPAPLAAHNSIEGELLSEGTKP